MGSAWKYWIQGTGRAEYRALEWWRVSLELVDINFLLFFALAVLVELDVVLEAFVAVGIGLVDLGVFGQLAVGLERTGLVGGVLHDHIALLVLVLTEREEDDITLVDPDLLAHLATDVSQTLFAIKAQSLQAAVAQHLYNLRILLAFLLEDKLALLVVVLVLSTATVLTALYMIVRMHSKRVVRCQQRIERKLASPQIHQPTLSMIDYLWGLVAGRHLPCKRG